MPPLLVDVTRQDQRDRREVVESTHAVHAVVVDRDGNVVSDTGAASRTTFARSAVKPFQAAACLSLLRSSSDELTAAEVAVSWASHRAEPDQLVAVERLLARSGTAVDELTCPAEAGAHNPCVTSRLTHNCSGKHALFALAGARLHLPRERLLDPAAPLQEHVLRVLDDTVGPIRAVGVDGCGAPAVAVPLTGLAQGFARLPDTDEARRVVAAGLAHPELVGGHGRAETALLTAGRIAKPGAEGVFGITLELPAHGPVGLALKAEDGAGRAASAAAIAIVEALGVPVAWEPPPPQGGGRPAGRVVVDLDGLTRFVAPALAVT